MEEAPKELDWVNERAKCEIKSAFRSLQKAVQEDIDTYSALPGLHSPIEFSSDPDTFFSVSGKGHFTSIAVFHRANDHIEINFHAQAIRAFPVFTEKGACKFRIDGEDGEPLFGWQLRRRVLESLLFTSQWA